MAVDVLYEAIEYGKVLFGYVFLMLVWPSVVFYKHLRGKQLVYHFGFCITAVPVCLNVLVLFLGLFHILSMSLTALLLVGIFIISTVRLIWDYKQDLPVWKKVYFFRILKSLWRENAAYKGLWIVTLLFGAVYFAYGAFRVSCYGFGDLYVHHAWIYGLIEGTPYKDGIYPEAMHCFVYCLKAVFGISVFSCLRFLQCIHVVVFLAFAGCLFREMFRWRYTPVLALLLFLILDVRGAYMITAMSRLQWSLPMEFGFPYVCICVLFLIRYIKGTPEGEEDKRTGEFWKNENLFVFMLAVTATLSIHYYTAIMAFLLCVPVALCAFRKVFHLRRLLPLLTAAACSLLVAAVPMAWALACGTPFEPSINWALGTLSGESARQEQMRLESANGKETEPDRAWEADRGGIYQNGYVKLYGEGRGALLLGLTSISLALCLAGKIRKIRWAKGIEYGYIPMLLMSVVYIATYAMPYMGLPQIITEGRFSAIGHPLTLASALIPLDIAGNLAEKHYGEKILQGLAVLMAVGSYVVVFLSGNYHGFLYYELSRYPEAVTLTRMIMENFEPYTYVIVSPTDELYQMIEKGFHIELLSFLESIKEEEYYLWADHLFFYVEKKPLYYAQLYFAEGPSWLGEEKYPAAVREEYEKLYSTWRVSQAPDVVASEISGGKAKREITDTDSWQKYTRLENREVLESRAYDQCMRLMETYPFQMEICFEDENFICFHLEQNLQNPCNLAIESKQ